MSLLVQSNNAYQLSDGNDAGTILGQSSTDLISFYNATPIVQPSGITQAAITPGTAIGSVLTVATTQSPVSAGVNPNTTAESAGLTLVSTTSIVQVQTTDLVYVNKPTSQAGLGVGNVRVSAANTLSVNFGNYTAATITPSATEVWTVVALRNLNPLTATLSPAAVKPGVVAEQQFTVPGIQSGALINVSKPTSQTTLDIVGVRAVSDNVVGIKFANLSATVTVTPTASESYVFSSIHGGLDATSNLLIYQSIQSPTATTNAVSSASQNFTITGIATTDTVISVVKPTIQANLGIVGWRVTSANTVSVSFGNFSTSTITPSATEVYSVPIYRTNATAPLVIYNQVLTPVSVAANTTAEQTFTVTGLIASSAVWVNYGAATAAITGLGIAGVRVSAANTLAINYVNNTSAAIVPPAESYIIGNYQRVISDTGSTIIQPSSYTLQANRVLTNKMRANLVSLGLISGA